MSSSACRTFVLGLFPVLATTSHTLNPNRRVSVAIPQAPYAQLRRVRVFAGHEPDERVLRVFFCLLPRIHAPKLRSLECLARNGGFKSQTFNSVSLAFARKGPSCGSLTAACANTARNVRPSMVSCVPAGGREEGGEAPRTFLPRFTPPPPGLNTIRLSLFLPMDVIDIIQVRFQQGVDFIYQQFSPHVLLPNTSHLQYVGHFSFICRYVALTLNKLWSHLSWKSDNITQYLSPCLKGIFAYLNYRVPRTRKEIFETLVKGLQRLEYRGYDSAGKTLGFR